MTDRLIIFYFILMSYFLGNVFLKHPVLKKSNIIIRNHETTENSGNK